MENLVNKILEIDHQADDLLKKAEEEKAKAMQQIEEEKCKIMEELKAQSNKKLSEFEEAQKKSAQEEMERIWAEQKREEEFLRKNYQKNSNVWAKELVDQCLHS